ncbi:MAG: MFS transporter [Spirochaetales bacterium]|nr:MFS transporter [Spirochaetales bacterium]
MATLLLVIIYIAFISLGLPDALLGAGWPVIQPDLNIPYSYAGIIQMTIAGGTIVSSMFAGYLIKKMGTGKLTAFSVALTAGALLGFSIAPGFVWLVLIALPLGLGAGAVDAGLNAYVASHYKSRHMSWLHSFWGLGALSGPLVLSLILHQEGSWRAGYRSIGVFQILLVIILVFSLPLWGRVKTLNSGDREENHGDLSLFGAMKIRGVPFALGVFLFYCGIEATMGLWGGSYLFRVKEMDSARAASWVSLFYGSITLGRFLSGFLTLKLSNNSMIKIGALIIFCGVILMLLPLPLPLVLAGFLMIGLGCAPVFPSMLHETPVRFGEEGARSIMGFQMAVAYMGSTFLPPLFGFIAGAEAMHLLPVFLLVYISGLVIAFVQLKRVTASCFSRNPAVCRG